MNIPFYIIFFTLWLGIGFLFKFKNSNKVFKGKSFKNENATLVYNYIGNELISHTFTIVIYFLIGYKGGVIFLTGMLATIFGLILHIRDVTGKSISDIFSKLNFSSENLKNNIFMRISLIIACIFLIFMIVFMIYEKINS